MIITCPACETRYTLTPSQIGAEGRMVRCKQCGHNWHQPPEQQAEKPPLPPANPHAAEQLAQPAQNSKKKVKLILAAVLMLGVMAALGTKFTPKNMWETALAPFSPPEVKTPTTPKGKGAVVAAALNPLNSLGSTAPAGTSTDSGLKIENVERRLVEEPDLDIMVFTGTIVNTNTEVTSIPEVRVHLLNEKGIELDFWPANVEKRTLNPGESTTWVCRFFNPPVEQVAEFRVTFAQK